MNIRLIKNEKGNILIWITVILVLIPLGFFSYTTYYGIKTIGDLLTENKMLKESLARLTHEDQIGYAKVTKQEQREGKLFTTLKFVETARDNKLNKILEKEYTVEGDIIHFDAIIVKFSSQLVLDGKERSVYLWRRVYGEDMPPKAGYSIEEIGKEPVRYANLLDKLRVKDQETFWTEIWDLSNDPQKLINLGVQAIYGNVVYSKLKPGLIYVFKISNTGQVYPETVPQM